MTETMPDEIFIENNGVTIHGEPVIPPFTAHTKSKNPMNGKEYTHYIRADPATVVVPVEVIEQIAKLTKATSSQADEMYNYAELMAISDKVLSLLQPYTKGD